MKSNSYHGYAPGERVPTDGIIALCDQRIRDGHVYESSIPEKQGYIDALRDSGHPFLVWTPISSGWGASPFNLNCWRTPEGGPVTGSVA